MRDLKALPKAHLHLHLEGGMRPATLAELSDKYGVAMPEVRGYGNFGAFVDMYRGACDVLRTEDDFRRLHHRHGRRRRAGRCYVHRAELRGVEPLGALRVERRHLGHGG
jgi:adenosine deaminase